MTTFETQIYKKEAENIIGAQVIVSSNNGQSIDSIQVTNKTQFDNLVAKLDTLNEDYTQFDEDSQLKGLTLDSILANENETVNINALTLNGLQSDQFSKANHNHYKATILDLYTYDISLSKYNASPGETITVTVKVTDTKGSPVKNNNVIIYLNNTSWKTGTTNVNGIFTTPYNTGSTEGLITFQVANQRVQCNVHYDTGWVNLTPGSGASGLFTNYDNDRPLQIRRVGKQVKIRGVLKTTRVINVVGQEGGTEPWYVLTLPSQFAPGKDAFSINPGSGFNKHYVKVRGSDNALLVAGKYGTTSAIDIPKGAYLACYISYFVD